MSHKEFDKVADDNFWQWYAKSTWSGVKQIIRIPHLFRYGVTWAMLAVLFLMSTVIVFIVINPWWLLLTIPIGFTMLAYGVYLVGREK